MEESIMADEVKVFLSWSGSLSHQVAATFADWLPDVIQSIETYLSSTDIDKGAVWYSEIIENLRESTIGIVFLTTTNINRPWIYFESGAIAGMFEKGRVCPLLIETDREEIKDTPLNNHMCTIFEKVEILKLVKSVNKAKKEGYVLEESRLERSFEKCWPDLEDKVNQIIEHHRASEEDTAKREKELSIAEGKTELEEILERVQYIHRILSDPETMLTPLIERMQWGIPQVVSPRWVWDENTGQWGFPSFNVESGSPQGLIRGLWGSGELAERREQSLKENDAVEPIDEPVNEEKDQSI